MNADNLYPADALAQLAARFLSAHPQASVRVLERQPANELIAFLQTMDAGQVAAVLDNMLPQYAGRLCNIASPQQVSAWLVSLSTRRMAAILRNMHRSQRAALLSELPAKTAAACRIFLSYPADTIGAWMSGRITALPGNINAGEALIRLQESEYPVDSDAIPVIDEERRLLGIISYVELSQAEKSVSVTEIMEHDLPAVSASASLASAEHHSGWRRYDTLQVLNREHRLIGLLRHVHLRDGLDTMANTGINEPAPADSLFGTLGKIYLQVLGTSFSWMSEALGRGSGNSYSRNSMRKKYE